MSALSQLYAKYFQKRDPDTHDSAQNADHPDSKLGNPKHLVKIYGERNSGTNFIQRPVRQNFLCQWVPGTLADAYPGYRESFEDELKSSVSDEAKRNWLRQAKMDNYFSTNLWNTLGWKHSCPPIEVILSRPDRSDILFVTITKHPYAWALSFFRRPYENPGISVPERIGDFLSEPWPSVRRDNTAACLESPIELWNLKTASYSQLAKVAHVLRCRYEDVLAEPDSFLEAESKHLRKKKDQYEVLVDAAKQQDKGTKDFHNYRDYYLNERWREVLTSDDIKVINRFLDPSVVKEAGYDILAPE